MKKKILCLLLVLAMFPIGFLFVGCAKPGYALTNLSTDYNNIVEDCTSFKILEQKIVVDYTIFKDTEQNAFLDNLITNKNPYKKINEVYNYMFNNSMLFAYSYLTSCAKDDIGVPEALALEVKTNLDNLKAEIKNVDMANSHLADIVKFALISSEDKELSESCISALRTLFEKYEHLLDCSLNFNNTLAKIYFGYAIVGGNVDYSKYVISDDETDPLNFKKETTISSAIGYITPKVAYQIANLTRCMLEIEIKAKNLPTSITTSPYNPPAFFTGYKTKVDAINKEITTEQAATIAGDAIQAQALLDNLVMLYNIQNSITNDAEIYYTAFATIEYSKVKQDLNNATVTEKMCADIIDNYNAIINNYQTVLAAIVASVVKTN